MYDQSILERFWSKVKKTDGCWEWIRNYDTYASLCVNGKMTTAHRTSWEIHNGPIPEGMCVCHHCDNKGCVRPDHLFLGTHSDNTLDSVRKGRHVSPFPVKLNEQKVLLIRHLYSRGVLQRELAEMCGVQQQAISDIVRRNTWRHI